jgi:hypothetical protein
VLDETFAACLACSLNARRQKLTDVFAAWNVVTHGTKLRIRSCFVLTGVRSRVKTRWPTTARASLPKPPAPSLPDEVLAEAPATIFQDQVLKRPRTCRPWHRNRAGSPPRQGEHGYHHHAMTMTIVTRKVRRATIVDAGGVEVAAIDNPGLKQLAQKVQDKLKKVLTAL